jgi:transcriptional regulator with XRE-family HTH domain
MKTDEHPLTIAGLTEAARGGRTNSQMASDIGVSTATVDHWISGKHPAVDLPNRKTLDLLAAACGVHVWTVIRAAANTLGITSADEPELVTHNLLPDASLLTDHQLAAIRILIRGLVARSDGE